MSDPTRRMVVGISGATGVTYAVRLLEILREVGIETHLVVTRAGEMTAAYEQDLPMKAENSRELSGKVVIDAANPYPARDGAMAETTATRAGGSATYVAALLPGARVAKAFNTIYWTHLRDEAARPGALLAMPIAGDDAVAVELAARLAEDTGFEPVVVGPLARSADLDPGSAIYAQSMAAAQVRQTLGLAD